MVAEYSFKEAHAELKGTHVHAHLFNCRGSSGNASATAGLLASTIAGGNEQTQPSHRIQQKYEVVYVDVDIWQFLITKASKLIILSSGSKKGHGNDAVPNLVGQMYFQCSGYKWVASSATHWRSTPIPYGKT